jgi:hypothetical protein
VRDESTKIIEESKIVADGSKDTGPLTEESIMGTKFPLASGTHIVFSSEGAHLVFSSEGAHLVFLSEDTRLVFLEDILRNRWKERR